MSSIKFFCFPSKDFWNVGIFHFQHLLEAGILVQVFCHKVTVLMIQHNLKVAFYLQVCHLWNVALELPQLFASPEETGH